MRGLPLALAATLVSSTAFAQAVTTRIETRPYYGAVVTVEQGVRVWRPLPPHDRIIINPDARANLTLDMRNRPGYGQGGYHGPTTSEPQSGGYLPR